MKGSAIGIVAAGCLAVGFGAGFILRPVISPVAAAPVAASAAAAAGVAQPSEEEATAAVRRYRRFTGTSLERATLKLGDCSPGGVGPGVTCMTQLVMDPTKPGAAPQNRPISFARVNGQWEVAVW
ncbi:hypothetical protein [Chelatococcus sp.]|jgi:hypothetical protein|uniref:hypothetical protein n=2 Tax=Hyphomicrobiales TaxID=356 RepID=UPI0025BD4B31|nr:hypothetical protein [Chelatococcus sp.]